MQILAIEFIKRNTKLIEALRSVYTQSVGNVKKMQQLEKENDELKKLLQLYINKYGTIKTAD